MFIEKSSLSYLLHRAAPGAVFCACINVQARRDCQLEARHPRLAAELSASQLGSSWGKGQDFTLLFPKRHLLPPCRDQVSPYPPLSQTILSP